MTTPPEHPRRRLRALPWLFAAVTLLGLAAWLMRVDPPKPAAPKSDVSIPRGMRAEEHKRVASRRTLPPIPEVPRLPSAPRPPAQTRDPMLALLPTSADPGVGSVVVLEANAVRHSPLGQLFLDCALSERDLKELADLKEKLGFDPVEDLDRVAIFGDVLALSGHFKGAKLDALGEGVRGRPFGDGATLYETPGEAHQEYLVTWGEQLVLVGSDEAQLQRAIDRLEGRAPAGEPLIAEHETYGEVYGRFSADDLAKLLPPEQADLAARIREAAESVELHVDASSDVGIVADVVGPSGERVEDLGKTLGAALALGRLKARADGEDELAQLLDLAAVKGNEGGRFSLELALPLSLLQEKLGPCKPRTGTGDAPAPREEPRGEGRGEEPTDGAGP